MQSYLTETAKHRQFIEKLAQTHFLVLFLGFIIDAGDPFSVIGLATEGLPLGECDIMTESCMLTVYMSVSA